MSTQLDNSITLYTFPFCNGRRETFFLKNAQKFTTTRFSRTQMNEFAIYCRDVANFIGGSYRTRHLCRALYLIVLIYCALCNWSLIALYIKWTVLGILENTSPKPQVFVGYDEQYITYQIKEPIKFKYPSFQTFLNFWKSQRLVKVMIFYHFPCYGNVMQKWHVHIPVINRLYLYNYLKNSFINN